MKFCFLVSLLLALSTSFVLVNGSPGRDANAVEDPSKVDEILSILKRSGGGFGSSAGVVLGTAYPSDRRPGIRNCTWMLETRYSGMTAPIPLWTNQPCYSVWDTTGRRWMFDLSTPGGGSTRQWVFPDVSYKVGPDGNCFRVKGCNYLTTVTSGQNMAVKVPLKYTGSGGYSNIDIYQGVNYDSGSGFQPVWNEYWIDTKTNETTRDIWSQPLPRGKNADGSCPPMFTQLYGEIIYAKTVTPLPSPSTLNTYFVLPSQCTPTVPFESDFVCWNNDALLAN